MPCEVLAMEEDETGQGAVHLDVDIMILEYLIHDATRALLELEPLKMELQNRLVMVDSFLAIFKSKYKIFSTQRRLAFRLQLLQFACLYIQRFDEPCSIPTNTTRDVMNLDAPLDIFKANINSKFCEKLKNQTPMSGGEMLQRYMICHTSPSDRLYALNPHACQSLLSMVVPFISLTAARKALGGIDGYEDDGWHVTPIWLSFAAEMIVQACLEQWLVLQNHTPHVLVQALSATSDKGLFDPTVWLSVVAPYLADIFNQPPLVVLSKYSAKEFHSKMLSFLNALLESLHEPELKQIEEGRLNGLADEDTRELLIRIGLG